MAGEHWAGQETERAALPRHRHRRTRPRRRAHEPPGRGSRNSTASQSASGPRPPKQSACEHQATAGNRVARASAMRAVPTGTEGAGSRAGEAGRVPEDGTPAKLQQYRKCKSPQGRGQPRPGVPHPKGATRSGPGACFPLSARPNRRAEGLRKRAPSSPRTRCRETLEEPARGRGPLRPSRSGAPFGTVKHGGAEVRRAHKAWDNRQQHKP